MLPVLMRQFSPQLSRNPSLLFREEIEAMDAYAANPASGVAITPPYPRRLDTIRTALEPEAWWRYVESPVEYPGRPERTVGEFLEAIFRQPHTPEEEVERNRAAFIFNFLFPLAEDDDRLLATRELFTLADDLGCELIAWFHPHNYEAGRRFLGAAFDESIAPT